jgi:hypothetical protein
MGTGNAQCHNPPVNRWRIAFLAVVLACFTIGSQRSTKPDLLTDSDTAVLLKAIRARKAPLSWFTGDWPLQNHFYRPISTLVFEADNALYGENAAGYGTTNTLLAILSVLLLFWLLSELTSKAALSAAAASLFALWTSGILYNWIASAFWAIGAAALVASLLPGRRVLTGLAVFFTAGYAAIEIGGRATSAIDNLPQFMISWLPGRTASVMTVFALIAMAAYARYERLGAVRDAKTPSPLDPPATKGTAAVVEPSKANWMWAIVALAATALALGSYEQAVMLPAALFGVALCLRFRRFHVRWGWQVGFWALLFLYLSVRKAVLPAGVSGYQQQQLRNGPTVAMAILDYVFPCAAPLWMFLSSAEWGVSVLFNSLFWPTILSAVANVVGMFQARRRWVYALTGWALSIITFLPMAWVKPFGHYAFWPLALRSLFVVTLAWIAGELAINAARRPALQAPARLDPAPGSLPHR